MTAPRPIATDILLEAGDWPSRARLRRIAAKVVDAANASLSPSVADGAELSLVFTDDAHSRELSRRFLNKDKATNVLSFPAASPESGRFGPILGDIVLARETVFHEAEAGGLTVEDHLAHLILHGFLHILGYDHQDEAEAAAMERLETALLGGIGIADPYSR